MGGIACVLAHGTSLAQVANIDAAANVREEARLTEVYALARNGQNSQALHKVRELVNDRPDFRSAQLMYADLLSARLASADRRRSQPHLDGVDARAKLETLRADQRRRLQIAQSSASTVSSPVNSVSGTSLSTSAPDELSLPAAVRAAVDYHPRIRTSSGQVAQAGEGIAAARAGYYPQVRAGVGTQLSNRDISPYDSRRLHTASISVSQMLYDFGKVSGAVNQAEATVSTARAQALLSVDDVARETAQAWVELYRQHVLNRIAVEQVQGVQALADLVNERERKGASSRSDVAQARSRVDAARAQELSIQAQMSRWRIQLMQLTGARVPVSIAGEPSAQLAEACLPGVSAQTFNPPAVQVAQAQREIAKADLRVADASLLPTLSVDGSVGRGLDARSRLPGENGISTSVSVNFSAPLYEGGGNQARQRAAAYAVTAADSAVAQAQLVAQQSLQDAQAQSQGQLARLPVLASRVDSIRATRDLYRQQYLQLGTRSLLDLLNAEQEYHSARFEQAESRQEQYRLGVECLYQTDRLRSTFAIDAASAVVSGAAR